MKPLVTLLHVNKVYSTGDVVFQALKDINLEINKSEFVAITGPSGSGKSTIMHILGLLDQPSSGSYFLNDQDTSKLKEETLARLRNQKIGFVFQSFNLLGRTPAWRNVALPLIYAGVEESEREKRAKEHLTQVGLGEKVNSLPNQLSGGQQQRVAIARALINNPEIILADEPTGNLDTTSGHDILEIFKSLHAQGRTIILITHDMTIAKNAKRIIYVRDGKIVSRV